MTRVSQARLAFFAIGIMIWGYGVATDDATIRWVGIGVLLISFVLRFFQKRPRGGDQPQG
jgi:hypothetical protein